MRSLRRHHRQRMIRRGLRLVAGSAMSEDAQQEWALRNHDHLAHCSCVSCMSPRKRRKGWRGLTLQERRALLAAWEDQPARATDKGERAVRGSPAVDVAPSGG
jgi:hypothetical protein